MPFWDRLSASFYGLDEALHIRRAVFFPQHPIILFSATEKVSLVLSMAEFVSGGSAPSFEPCYEFFFRFLPVLLRRSSTFGTTQLNPSSPSLEPCDRELDCFLYREWICRQGVVF